MGRWGDGEMGGWGDGGMGRWGSLTQNSKLSLPPLTEPTSPNRTHLPNP
jgi:hypothetical protein